MHRLALLSTTEMALADRLAVSAGVASLDLMEHAGRAVADEARTMTHRGSRIAVICGPGSNGGDGFVAARLLREDGYDVQVSCLVAREQLSGDAAVMASRWSGDVSPGKPPDEPDSDLIIDALFGSGLSRPLEGVAAAIVCRLRQLGSSKPILAIDIPSGLDGNTGDLPVGADGSKRGPLFRATRTVTFFRAKPGHFLLPGRELCGDLKVVDIGLPAGVLDDIRPQTFRNDRGLWLLPKAPSAHGHKYSRGHAVIVSGPPQRTGAARLGARGALRIGAGLVTIASPLEAVPVNAAHLTAIMIAPFEAPEGLAPILADERHNAILVGPGCGVGATTRRMTEIALASPADVVLDADALTSFKDVPEALFELTRVTQIIAADPWIAAAPKRLPRTLLTPHDGEFKRLFPAASGSRLQRARYAADKSGAIVILKGSDTVIAAPDGRAAINHNAPPTLATAGSGDVLAGFIVGLLAQRLPAWEAACAAVWLHGECATAFGPGLIAEDLSEMLPKVLHSISK